MPHPRTGSPGLFSRQVLRRFLAIFLSVALVLGGVVTVLYYQDLANERTLHEQAGEHLVALHSNLITRELKGVESDLLYLANQAALRDFLAGGASAERALQDEYLLFCRQKGIYDQIRYLNAGGQETIRINYNNGAPAVVAENELQSKANRYYFTQAMSLPRGEVFISRFDLNVEHDAIEQPLKPALRFATPVFDRQGAKRGVLVLNYLGAALIRKLVEVSVSFPGSALLLNPDGYFLHGRHPDEEWDFMFGNERTFAREYPEEWRSLVGKSEGRLVTPNGLFTWRTLSPRATLPVRHEASAAGHGLPDPDGADARLKIVAHVPPEVLTGHARQTLGRVLLLYGVALLLVLFLAGYLSHAGALRRHQALQLAASEGRLRALSSQLMTAQEDERRNLSRDLHDELGQLGTAVTLDLQRAAQTTDPAKKDELIGRGLHEATCMLDRIHELSTRVRPTILDDLGLKDAVQSYLSDYEGRTGIVTRSELRFEQAQVPAVVSENIYRILQEALTNVAKHAQTTEVQVKLHASACQVSLLVQDAGKGFAPAAVDGQRLGLLGMRERAELLDGTFTIRSTAGKGTEIEVTIPVSS